VNLPVTTLTPSADITGGGPATPGVQTDRPKRVVLSRICFVAFLVAIEAFRSLGGLWPLVDAALFATMGVVLSLQTLKPSLLPMRRILPSSYGLTNRKVPASRAYGTPYDRAWRAVGAMFCLYVAASTHAALVIPVTESSSVAPDNGIVVFADDFRDASSGWSTASAPGLSRAYLVTSYIVTVTGAIDYTFGSPRARLLQQVAAAATATTPSDTPLDAGFGVECRRGTGGTRISYESVLSADGSWTIARRDGDPTLSLPRVLLTGSSLLNPSGTPNTVELMCATLPNLSTTRLIFYINGSPAADLLDTPSNLPGPGWWVGLIVAGSDSAPATFTVTYFEERDLATRVIIQGPW
jgi:hypothetical protein